MAKKTDLFEKCLGAGFIPKDAIEKDYTIASLEDIIEGGLVVGSEEIEDAAKEVIETEEPKDPLFTLEELKKADTKEELVSKRGLKLSNVVGKVQLSLAELEELFPGLFNQHEDVLNKISNHIEKRKSETLPIKKDSVEAKTTDKIQEESKPEEKEVDISDVVSKGSKHNEWKLICETSSKKEGWRKVTRAINLATNKVLVHTYCEQWDDEGKVSLSTSMIETTGNVVATEEEGIFIITN